MKKILFAVLLIFTLLCAASCQRESLTVEGGKYTEPKQTEQVTESGEMQEDPSEDPEQKPEEDPGEEPEEEPSHQCSFAVTERIEPTCVENGWEKYTCQSCQESYTEVLYAVGGHDLTKYVSDENATCTADGTLSARCRVCGEISVMVDAGSMLDHRFKNYRSDKNATCIADGTMTAKCENCDATHTKVQEDSRVDHVFKDYISNNDATCLSNGTMTARCEVCKHATDTVVEGGTRKAHSFTNYLSRGDASCQSDGTKGAFCDGCGVAYDIKPDVGSKLSCEARQWFYDGSDTLKGNCRICGEECFKEAEECDHRVADMDGDGRTIWYECTDCEAGFTLDYLLTIEVSESDCTDGFCLEISSEISCFPLDITKLMYHYIEVDKTCESFGEYNRIQDYAHLITELKVGENITDIVDLYSFRYTRRITLGEGVENIRTNSFSGCALLDELYMEGDCPELESGALYRSPTAIDGIEPGFFTPTLYYTADAEGYEGYKLQGFTLCRIGAEAPTAPHDDIFKYSEDTVKESIELGQIFFEAFEESGNDLHLMPMCNLERYEEIYLLAHQLCEGKESEYDKARAIYEWIVANITYDSAAKYYTVAEVYAERIAVCNGYAILMHDMLAAVGISSLYTQGITTDAILYGLTVEKLLDGSHWFAPEFGGLHHAWLLCYVDGEIIISDPTWSQFDISEEALAATRVTLGIYGIDVIPDDFDPALYESINYYDNGKLYNLSYGRLPEVGGNNLIFNYSFSVYYRYYTPNDGYAFEGEAPDVYCAYSNIVAEYGEMGYRERFYADGSFRQHSYLDVVKYLLFNMRMGNDVMDVFGEEFIFDEIGNIYLVLNDRELELVGTIFGGSELVIPARVGDRSVVGIGWMALEGCLVEKIVIPDSVTYILSGAFRGCVNVREIILPKNLKSLGCSVFSYCYGLERVVIPISVEFIGLPDNRTLTLPYDMFYDLSPDTLTVVYEGSREQYDAINFYDPWAEDTGWFDQYQYDHMLPFMEFME